jgi:hypothetical protein
MSGACVNDPLRRLSVAVAGGAGRQCAQRGWLGIDIRSFENDA